MAHEASDLDVMHGQDHRTRAAALGEGGAQLGKLPHRAAKSTQLRRNGCGKRADLFQRCERLAREAGLAVNVTGVGCGNLVGDLFDGGQKSRKSLLRRSAAHRIWHLSRRRSVAVAGTVPRNNLITEYYQFDSVKS